jgi:hypothetical protein
MIEANSASSATASALLYLQYLPPLSLFKRSVLGRATTDLGSFHPCEHLFDDHLSIVY